MMLTKKSILIYLYAFGFFALSNAQTNKIDINRKGIFSEIETEKHTTIIQRLQNEPQVTKVETIKDIVQNSNNYNPPVLFAMSQELYKLGFKYEASFWFYVAQLRARYDANRCMDDSAKQAVTILNNTYGPKINEYAFKDINSLKELVIKVVDFVKSNKENYDHRWINLHGMWAVQEGLGTKTETRALSKPEEEWQTIKSKTIDDYYNGFITYITK